MSVDRKSINGLYKSFGLAFINGQTFGVRLYFNHKTISIQKHTKRNKVVVITRDIEQTEYCEKLSMIGDDEILFIGVLKQKK